MISCVSRRGRVPRKNDTRSGSFCSKVSSSPSLENNASFKYANTHQTGDITGLFVEHDLRFDKRQFPCHANTNSRDG